jgi:hypothetical protein
MSRFRCNIPYTMHSCILKVIFILNFESLRLLSYFVQQGTSLRAHDLSVPDTWKGTVKGGAQKPPITTGEGLELVGENLKSESVHKSAQSETSGRDDSVKRVTGVEEEHTVSEKPSLKGYASRLLTLKPEQFWGEYTKPSGPLVRHFW